MLACYLKMEKSLTKMGPMLGIPRTSRAQMGYEGNYETASIPSLPFSVTDRERETEREG